MRKITLQKTKLFRVLLKYIANFLPREKKIFFCSYDGKAFTCNPYYIFEKLSLNDFKYVIVSKDTGSNKNVKYVGYKTIEYYYQYLTSMIVITNNCLPMTLPKLERQYLINTWHGGGAYKKVDAHNEIGKEIYKLMYSSTDCFLSSCKLFTQVMTKDIFLSKDKFFSCGMPRNDIFFDNVALLNIKDKVRRILGISTDDITILYAPIWRDDGRVIVEELTDSKFIKNIEVLYGKKIKFLIRAHHNTRSHGDKNNDHIINVSSYSNMQELLCLADILITDYSSCMWDFSLMYKPCFIYATDIDKYKQERDFYTPMSEWPFPIATNTEELLNNIKNFNEKEYVEKVKQHHKALGSYEDGHATEKVCKLIEDICLRKV